MVMLTLFKTQPIRVSFAHATNYNSITLEFGELTLNLYELPREQTDILMTAFADSKTIKFE